MNDPIRDRATRFEELVPTILRRLYGAQESDPLRDLPVAQLKVLRLLNSGPKNHSAVSEEIGTSVSAVTQVANRLEALGLIERVESPADRRVKTLQLTGYGQKCMSERREDRILRTMGAMNQMSEEQQVTLMHALEDLLEGCSALKQRSESISSTTIDVPGEAIA